MNSKKKIRQNRKKSILSPKKIIILPAKSVRPFFEEKWNLSRARGKNSVYSRINPGVLFFIRVLKKKRTASNILDLGCGDGRFSLRCAQNGFFVTGIDFSLSAIMRLKERATRLGVSRLVSGKVARIETVNFGKRKFDGVMCCNTLHYFNDSELRKIVKRMKRATRKGGLNIVSFEVEISMKLPSAKQFRFENQPSRSVKEIKFFLGKEYKNWKTLKVITTSNSIRASLPRVVKKQLNTTSDYYFRSFKVFEIITQKT